MLQRKRRSALSGVQRCTSHHKGEVPVGFVATKKGKTPRDGTKAAADKGLIRIVLDSWKPIESFDNIGVVKTLSKLAHVTSLDNIQDCERRQKAK